MLVSLSLASMFSILMDEKAGSTPPHKCHTLCKRFELFYCLD